MNLEQIIDKNLKKFGQKTTYQLRGSLPIKTQKLINELDYSISGPNLSLYSTNYFVFVLAQTWRTKTIASLKIIEQNKTELIDQLGKDIVKELSIVIQQPHRAIKVV